MKYKNQELKSLYEVKLYVDDPDKKKPKTVKETVIAFNHVDALRQCGNRKAAEMPKFLHHVTWDEIPKKITSTAGPEDIEVEPTIKDTK